MLAHPALLSRSYRNATINSLGLGGYWRLGATAGTVAKDECGKNDGAYTGSPTLGVTGALAGDPNTAVTFASGKYVGSFGSSISAPGTRTVLAWINPGSTSRIGIMGTGEIGANNGFVLTANRTTAGNLTYFHKGGTLIELAAGLTSGSWFFVGASYNSVSGIGTLYVNGVSLGTVGSFANDGTSAVNGLIGEESSDFGNPFVGSIDEVAIWNRVLAGAEVANLYRIGRGF